MVMVAKLVIPAPAKFCKLSFAGVLLCVGLIQAMALTMLSAAEVKKALSKADFVITILVDM